MSANAPEQQYSSADARRVLKSVLLIMAAVAAVVLRLIRLQSDAYPHLSWSSALLTDEGFYIHNARNVVLFGTARTDEFNNMLIMPTLHFVQVWVFRMFGVGAVQARSISVVCGILETALLTSAVWKIFGKRSGIAAGLFVGLGHTSLLYSRMALMDTPAALFLTVQFSLWAVAMRRVCAAKSPGVAAAAAGMVAGICYVTRGLSVWCVLLPWAALPAALKVLPLQRKACWLTALAHTAGFASVFTIYVGAWYLPNHNEIAAMNHFYLVHQLMPTSIFALKGNLTQAVIGDYRGLFPYLFRHSIAAFVVTVTVAAATMATAVQTRSKSGKAKGVFADAEPLQKIALVYLGFWMLLPCAAYAVISYAPDRYYVLFYPAMAAIAGAALWRIGPALETLRGSWVLATLAGLLGYHAAEALVHHRADWALAVAPVCAVWAFRPKGAAAAWLMKPRVMAAAPVALLSIWCISEVCWTADWLMHPTYTQRDMCQFLERTLPANAVLLGDVAPGLALDSKFRAVAVMPGLCNYDSPLEIAAKHPSYITILDGRFLEHYWTDYCPEQLTQQHRVAYFPAMLGKYPVGVYRVGRDTTVLPPQQSAERQ